MNVNVFYKRVTSTQSSELLEVSAQAAKIILTPKRYSGVANPAPLQSEGEMTSSEGSFKATTIFKSWVSQIPFPPPMMPSLRSYKHYLHVRHILYHPFLSFLSSMCHPLPLVHSSPCSELAILRNKLISPKCKYTQLGYLPHFGGLNKTISLLPV